MGVQQAPEQWAVTVTLLDVFSRYECGPNAAAVPSGITWGSREQSREAGKAEYHHSDTF